MEFKYMLFTIFSLFYMQLSAIDEALVKGDEITVTCTVNACGGTLQLFEFDGAAFRPLLVAKVKSDSLYTFNVPKSEPSFYYIGNEPTKVKPIILGSEEEVVIKGQCGKSFELTIEESVINKEYIKLKAHMSRLRNLHGKYAREFRSAKTNEDRKAVAAKMRDLDDQKLDLLESLKEENPYFASIVAVNTYLSFQNNTKEYPNEIHYFAGEFFRFADLSDEHYNRSSWLFEALKGYAYTLTAAAMDKDRHMRHLEAVIDQIPEGSKARKLAMSGAIVILNQKNHPNFIPLAERFISEYKELDVAATTDLQKQVDQIKPFLLGGQAPNFVQKSPEGEEINLSDFRGKVLLVDFWASWCGPCRRENPHVVSLYKKYRDQGFEILGVSLDNNKDRWLKAIATDKLEWKHVSDLKGWKNEVAKMYNITAIPHTILLDEEGKIIARNLRGHSLEQKLEELFD